MGRDTPSSRAPLRKVVDFYADEHGAMKEKLECGHVIGRKQDIYGYTNADRRRCRYCRQEAANGK